MLNAYSAQGLHGWLCAAGAAPAARSTWCWKKNGRRGDLRRGEDLAKVFASKTRIPPVAPARSPAWLASAEAARWGSSPKGSLNFCLMRLDVALVGPREAASTLIPNVAATAGLSGQPCTRPPRRQKQGAKQVPGAVAMKNRLSDGPDRRR